MRVLKVSLHQIKEEETVIKREDIKEEEIIKIIMKNALNLTKITVIFLISYFVLLFSSCDKGLVYQQFKTIDKSGWHQDSILRYVVEINDTIKEYDIIIDIRNTNFYPYQNLHLFVSSFSPENQQGKDTLNCMLADKMGRWQGKGQGALKSIPFIYVSQVRFPQKGEYVFKIQQGMRERKLIGISDVGLRIQESQIKTQSK